MNNHFEQPQTHNNPEAVDKKNVYELFKPQVELNNIKKSAEQFKTPVKIQEVVTTQAVEALKLTNEAQKILSFLQAANVNAAKREFEKDPSAAEKALQALN